MSLILVIEDDPRIQRALQRQFIAEGYEVKVEGDGPAGLAACKALRPATVVLDLMLPGLSGREICKEIKAWSIDMPVIVLSAVTEVADKVLLLETGADDYMTKPFSPRELLARVQAMIRRAGRKAESRSLALAMSPSTSSRWRFTRPAPWSPLPRTSSSCCGSFSIIRAEYPARRTAQRCLGA